MIWIGLAMGQQAPPECAHAVPLGDGVSLDAWIGGATDRLAIELGPGVYPIAADLSQLDALVLCGTGPGVLITSNEPTGTFRGPIVELTLYQVGLGNGNGPALDVQLVPGGTGIHLSQVTTSVSGVNPAVRIEGSGAVEIVESVFSGGVAFAGAHLALYGGLEPLQVEVRESTFVDGLATGHGGAIFSDPQTVLQLVRSEFVGNRASSGGAVAATGPLAVEGGRFEANAADCQGPCEELEGLGGAISATGPSIELGGMATFVDNEAEQHGGAVALAPGSVQEMRDLTFCRNVAVDRGGGIYLQGTARVQMGALRIIENRAAQGGGVYGTAQVSRSNLLANEATQVGAAMAGEGEERSVLTDSIAAWNTGSAWVDPTYTEVRGRVALWQNAGPDATRDLDGSPPAFRGYAPGRGDCEIPADFMSVASSGVVSGDFDFDLVDWGTCPGVAGAICIPSPVVYGAYGLYGPGGPGVSHYDVAWVDSDGDGWPAIFDCADHDATVDPESSYSRLKGFDTDCDGAVDLDFDGDGYLPPEDCNDNNPLVHPGAEPTEDVVGDYTDVDCNGEIEDDAIAYVPARWGYGCTSVAVNPSRLLLPLFALRR